MQYIPFMEYGVYNKNILRFLRCFHTCYTVLRMPIYQRTVPLSLSLSLSLSVSRCLLSPCWRETTSVALTLSSLTHSVFPLQPHRNHQRTQPFPTYPHQNQAAKPHKTSKTQSWARNCKAVLVRAMKAYGEVKVQLHSFTASSLDQGSGYIDARATLPQGNNHSNQQTDGWVGPKARLNSGEAKNSLALAEIKPCTTVITPTTLTCHPSSTLQISIQSLSPTFPHPHHNPVNISVLPLACHTHCQSHPNNTATLNSHRLQRRDQHSSVTIVSTLWAGPSGVSLPTEAKARGVFCLLSCATCSDYGTKGVWSTWSGWGRFLF